MLIGAPMTLVKDTKEGSYYHKRKLFLTFYKLITQFQCINYYIISFLVSLTSAPETHFPWFYYRRQLSLLKLIIVFHNKRKKFPSISQVKFTKINYSLPQQEKEVPKHLSNRIISHGENLTKNQ